MKITFVNHASTIFSKDGINLISDPWIEGKVFHNGWSLLSETQFTYSDFEKITHIWFSHEHPDHFFPPNLKLIPLEIRKKITVLFQYTKDKKVIEFCKFLEFKEVIELRSNTEFNLTPNFKIIVTSSSINSWLYIKTDTHTFLNTNDCVLNSMNLAEEVSKVTGDIDVLLTQFSYASKYGNTNQPEERERASEDKYRQMTIQIEAFKPKYFIPIASFVWFSHEENFYMNDRINKIDSVENFIRNHDVTPVVLYPGETYSPDDPVDNSKSLQKYQEDYKKIKFENATKTQPVELDQIKKSAKDFSRRIRKENLFGFAILALNPIKFHLTDLKKTVEFSILFGFNEIHISKEKADILITSEVLDYCFKFNWGFSATGVNGRFQSVNEKGLALFNGYTTVEDCINFKDSTFIRALNKIARSIQAIFQ